MNSKSSAIKLITGEDISKIERQIKQDFVDSPSVSRLSEKEFRNFVPFFTGQANLFEREDVITDWITIAGSRYAPVDVYDQLGQTLFRVPGLFSSGLNVTDHENSSSVRDIIHGFTQRQVMPPKVANDYILNELYSKSEDLAIGTSPNAENERLWSEVFKYYSIEVGGDANAAIAPIEEDFLIDD